MLRKKTGALLFASIFCAAVFVGGGSFANATTLDDPPPLPTDSTEITTCRPLFDPVRPAQSVTWLGGRVQTIVPRAASDGLIITNTRGVAVTVGLPDAANAGPASNRGCYAVEYSYSDWRLTVVGSDLGMVGIGVAIAQDTSAERYSFSITGPAGARIAVRDDGSVAIVDRAGILICLFGRPASYDAGGAVVPTSYEVEGSTMTLVVLHRSATVSYPVAAGNIYVPGSME